MTYFCFYDRELLEKKGELAFLAIKVIEGNQDFLELTE